jgi:multidrug efflux pump subunit AcrB/outer membrane protein TolC
MNPVRSSLRHAQVTAAITLMLVGAGAYALLRMPRREDPKITVPIGIVAAFYPGATAEEVETQVSRKIEEKLFRTAGVRREKTYSTSLNGGVYVYVYLEDNVKDTDTFWSKMRLDMAQLKMTDLPEGVIGPVVDSDFGDTVAVLIALHSDRYGYRELKDYAERIDTEIRAIRTVSKIRRIGEQKEQIEVTSSLERLSQYSVDPLKVIAALKGRSTVQYAGAVPTEHGKPPIEATGAFQTEDQIRRVMIDVSRSGQPVYIGDLASVERVYKDPSQYARVGGERAILLAVEMQEGNNIVDFGKAVHASLDRLRPGLPPDLRIELVADQPKIVSERIRGFIHEFGIAIASVILVTLLLLPFRVALVSAVAIPVTVAVTFGILNAVGIELHQVSIAALVVVLGMVVDDAIVIADNYLELLDRGVAAEEGAWRSATELAVPVLTATLTIIGSFLPLLMLSGAVGEFIQALPLTVTFALGISYVVAMLLTPLLSRLFIRKGLHAHEDARARRRRSPLELMQSVYNHVIETAMRWKPATVGFGILAIAAGAVLLRMVPEQFFPSAERNQFVVDVWLPEGWKVEATDAAVQRVEQVLREEKEVSGVASFIGASAPRFYYNVNPQLPDSNYAQVLVATKSPEATPGLVSELRPKLSRAAPEARIFIRELQQGTIMEAPVEVRIGGHDKDVLRSCANQVLDILHSTSGTLDPHADWREDSYRVKVNVREELANRFGLTNASIARQLAGGFEGAPVTTYWEGDRDVAVVLRLEPSRRRSFESVSDTYVTSMLTGVRVPVSSIATLSPEWDAGRIVRRNGVRTVTLRSWAAEGNLASQVLDRIRPSTDAIALPAGYRMSYGGEYENQQETFSEMKKALLVSVAAIYLILLFQFRSILDPLVIMATIPLALPGAAVGLLVTGNPFGFTAFLGIVSLGGVVVRNAIILVDYIRTRMAEGVPVEQAAIEAGERRLRPIFLTTMAAAVGVTPMILSGSSLWSPLASAIAFGLIGSMFFTIVVIPALYVLLHRRSSAPRSAVAAMLLVVFVFTGSIANAEPRKLTLEQAVDLAARQNAVVRLAGEKVKEMDARVESARANYFPSVASDVNTVHITEQQRLDIPRGSLGVYPGAGPIPGQGIILPLGNHDFLLSTVTVTQPITQVFKIRAGTDVARADAAGARADVHRAEDEIALKVKEVFYGILATGRRRDAVAAQIRAGEMRIAEAKNAVESGVALDVRVAEGRAQIAQARHGLGQLEDAVADLMLELTDLVGLPPGTELELVTPEGPAADAPPGPAALEAALAHNPEIEAAGHQLEKARAAMRAARAEYIPEVGAFAQYIYQNGVPLLSRNNGVIGVRMTWTMFEFGKRRGQVAERSAQIEQAEQNLERLRNRVRIDVEKALRRLNRTGTGIDAAKELVASRAEARRIAADQVEAGTANASNLQEAEAALLDAQAALLRAECDKTLAAATLTRLIGVGPR